MARAARLLAAACALLAAAGAAASELATLFHSPEERARLDRLRRGEAPAAARAPEARRDPRITGFVKRSDGRSTVWIDGVPVPVSNPRAARLLDPSALRGSGDEGDGAVKVERSR